MSIGNSKAEQELTAMLAQTLVQKEVMEPMGKIGWGHSAPPPPDSGQPAPAEGAPAGQAATTTAAPAGQPAPTPATTSPNQSKTGVPTDPADLVALYETLRDPETGLIMKKYKTIDEAIRGTGHSVVMAKQAFSERDAALIELRKMQQENLQTRHLPEPTRAQAPQPAPVVAPSRALLDNAQAKLEKVLSGIAENGGVLDAENAKTLSAAQREVAEAAADVRMQEKALSEKAAETAERAQWREVDDYMSTNHPDAAKFADEVALHLQSDPLLAKAMNAMISQGDRIGATELVWKSFQRLHGEQVRTEQVDKEADLAARGQVREEQLKEARKDAGVIQGSAGGAGIHMNKNAAGASREEIQALGEAAVREGMSPGTPAAMRWRAAVIGPSLGF